MRARLLAAAFAAVLALAGCSGDAGPTVSAGAVSADWIFHGGTVLTMNPDLPRAEAIAVRGDEIVAVGTDAEVMALASDATAVVDLDGSTLMPGFVDAHAHYAQLFDGTPGELQDWLLSMGVTTVAELAVTPEVMERMAGWRDAGELRVRWNLYLVAYTNCGESLGDWYLDYPPTGGRGAMFSVAGVKLYADGGSCGVPAGTRPDGAEYGDLWFTPDELEDHLRRIDGEGYQIALHALGDRAIDEALTAYAAVLGDGGNPLRHRIEHNTLVDPSFAGRYDRLGLTGTIFGAYPTCDFAEISAAQAGPDGDPIEREWNWRRLLDGNPGTEFGWSSDAMLPLFPDPSPARSLVGFTSRLQRTDDGGVCDPTPVQLEGSVTVEEALHVMTVGSAYALRREDEIGALRPGMLADLTIWSDDPTAVDPARLLDTTVELTMVGGVPGHCVGGYEAYCS